MVVGCRVLARPIGLLHMRDEHGPDDKVLFVPANDSLYDEIRELCDVAEVRLRQIEEFFRSYKELGEGMPEVFGWDGVAAAVSAIAQAGASGEASVRLGEQAVGGLVEDG